MKTPNKADSQAFREEWAQFFGDTPPFGWRLRARDTPWLRYHALPDSKRYADNDAERATILLRANTIGDRLLSAGSSCWYVEARFDDEGSDPNSMVEFREMDDGEELVWRFHVRPVEWCACAFDAKLRAVADDELEVLWMRRSDGTIFAPYDGGFDLFPRSFDDVETLKEERADWLSSHPSGL